MTHELDLRDFGLMGLTTYKGCIVSKMIGKGYSVFGVKCIDGFEVDELLEKAAKVIESSIQVVNNGNFACINDGSVDFKEDFAKKV